MTNAELIKQLRGCKDIEFCNECPRMPNGIIEPCGIKDAAADALEADEKRIAELSLDNKMLKNTIDADKGVMLDRIRYLEAQLPKEGNWIPVTNGRGGHECSLCHGYAPTYQNGDEHLSDYCPNCGARMKGEQE